MKKKNYMTVQRKTLDIVIFVDISLFFSLVVLTFTGLICEICLSCSYHDDALDKPLIVSHKHTISCKSNIACFSLQMSHDSNAHRTSLT